MQVPPEIVTKGVKTTPYIDELLTRGIARLEKVCDYIISTRVALEQAQGRRQRGNPYRMRIDVRIPDREIVVKRWSKALTRTPDGHAQVQTQTALKGESETEMPRLTGRSVRRRGIREEPVVALIRRTFDSAQRELEQMVERQRGEVKIPAQQEISAVVQRILREQGYGFLRTPEGEEIYFHKNSVLHGHWDDLKVGTAVRYTLELGEKGLQASSVEPTHRPGAAEAHDVLHELPVVSSQSSRKRR
ncbi:MAG: HPF/RaiA family ribosome-associated protein [Chloroflexi bacterium]|nr:HPF/RaiA family ribosome-associated protein [Chloroflexota bacterium]